MAKKKKQVKKIGGPFLAAAVFCESIMEDSGGKVSAIGILDGCELYIPPDAPPDVPSETQAVGFSQNVLLIFRSGDAPGKHKLWFVIERPDGKRLKHPEREIELSSPPNGGLHLKTTAFFKVASSGVYWFDVFLDGKRFTRMPLNITIQRLPSQKGVTATAGLKRK